MGGRALNVEEAVSRVETAGAEFRLDGEKVRVWYPTEERREELEQEVAFLRAHREEVVTFLQSRALIPPMPPGVHLITWHLKRAPIAIEYHALVTDSAQFAKATLEELRERLLNRYRKYGWSVPQLLDRLAQVGVQVK